MNFFKIALPFFLFISCSNKENFAEAEKTLEQYYTTYNTFRNISEFDKFLSDDFKSKYEDVFVQNTQIFRDSLGPVINYKNERMSSLSSGLNLLKIRIVYDVEYTSFYNKEIFDLIKDSVDNQFKIEAFRIDTYKIKK